MSVSFACPACRATISGSDFLVGRKVRCPECDDMVVVPADLTPDSPAAENAGSSDPSDATGTVYLTPSDIADPRETVMLESVDVIEPAPIEIASNQAMPPAAGMQPIQVPPPPVAKDTQAGDDAESPPMEPNRKLEETEMDMTPMVDVTFLLLIFFMVTASFTLQKSMEIPLAKSDQASTNVKDEEPEEENETVTVVVDENNTFQVSTNDWEEEAPSVQDLHIQLRLAREGDSTGTIPTTLRVEANGEAMYDRVVAALDAGPKTGFSEVELVSVETE